MSLNCRCQVQPFKYNYTKRLSTKVPRSCEPQITFSAKNVLFQNHTPCLKAATGSSHCRLTHLWWVAGVVRLWNWARIRFSLLRAAEYMEKISNTLLFSAQSTQDSGWKSTFHIFNSREGCFKKNKSWSREVLFLCWNGLIWEGLFLCLPFWRTEVLMTNQKLLYGQIIKTVWV